MISAEFDCENRDGLVHVHVSCVFDGVSCGEFELCLASCPVVPESQGMILLVPIFVVSNGMTLVSLNGGDEVSDDMTPDGSDCDGEVCNGTMVEWCNSGADLVLCDGEVSVGPRMV